MDRTLTSLLKQVRACDECRLHLPLGPNPVLQISNTAKIVIIGQAPGAKVHESSKPWADTSGDHLRQWLEITEETFYNPSRVALIPMGFCYPGKKPGGDAPPRKNALPYGMSVYCSTYPKIESSS